MGAKRLNVPRLAFLNIVHRPVRAIGLIVIVAAFAFVIFGGNMLNTSLKTGIDNMADRLGADLMVIPKGADQNLENSLLRSEPSTFYMEDNIVCRLALMDGVEKASYQLFIASLDAACCTEPVQLIGYDPETDFIIKPWMVNSMTGELSFGDVVVGNLVLAEPGDEVTFFGQPFKVAAKLDKTGMGFDSSIFMTADTAQHMIDLSGERAVHPAGDSQDLISAVFLKIKNDTDLHQIVDQITKSYENVEVVISDDFMSNISNKLNKTSGITYVVAIFLWIAAILVLLFVFSITFNERKREFALLAALGADRKRLTGIIMCESLMIAAAGTICGIFITGLILFPFQTLISVSMELPYLMPDFMSIIKNLFVSVVISISMGPIACFYSAMRMSKTDTYFILRENE
ncbi:MAG: ABC transporter permease [Lachnospiraceae bacterium]|nr:ABC transporter permease [Lachnospiraceae bacterium]MDE6185067.1 ABC transporter permease [Lachnospiraceae bacterium]